MKTIHHFYCLAISLFYAAKIGFLQIIYQFVRFIFLNPLPNTPQKDRQIIVLTKFIR